MNSEKQRRITLLVNVTILSAVSIVLFIGFKPLFEATPEGVAREILVAGLGALFVTLITLILLDRQNEAQKEPQ